MTPTCLGRCQQASGTRERPLNEIKAKYGADIFDTPYPNNRERIDLDAQPLLDAAGGEIRIYDVEGRRIPRVLSGVAPDEAPCGILMDLRAVHPLFEVSAEPPPPLNPDWSDGDDPEEGMMSAPRATPTIRLYPQAFMRTIGHFQADGILPHFDHFLEKIEAKFMPRQPGGEEAENDDLYEDEDEDDDPIQLERMRGRVVHPLAFQAYNELSHQTRPNAGLHDVQQGHLTSALSGCHAINGTGQKRHQDIYNRCRVALPHERFASKIDTPAVPRDLRLEVVIVLDMDAMPTSKRRGG